jgi:nucleolar protein 56
LLLGFVFSYTIHSGIDDTSDTPTSKFGEALRAQVEERLNFFETGAPPSKNVDAIRKVLDELALDEEEEGDGEEPVLTTLEVTPKKEKKKRKRDAMDVDGEEEVSAEKSKLSKEERKALKRAKKEAKEEKERELAKLPKGEEKEKKKSKEKKEKHVPRQDEEVEPRHARTVSTQILAHCRLLILPGGAKSGEEKGKEREAEKQGGGGLGVA